MERFSWWRMEQVQHPLSRALCGAFCSILHHVKRSMSHPPHTPLPSIKNENKGSHTLVAPFRASFANFGPIFRKLE